MNLNVGDKVNIAVCEESREWGYNPAPDGTIVEVVGFNDIAYGYFDNYGREPGIYLNRCWPEIKLPSGEVISLGYWHLKPINEEVINYRHHECNWEDDWVRELPETKFYPDDKVRGTNRAGTYSGKVARIDYMDMDRKRDDGSPWPFYSVDIGGQMSYEEGQLELIERGNVWRILNGEKPVFSSLEEEAKFEMRRGRYDEVRNPANQLYCWEKYEILSAIARGEADGISFSDGIFGSGNRVVAIKFRDEDLGKRIAKLTLEGFSKG